MEWTFERAIAGIMAITPFLESRAAMIETSASRKMLRVLDGVSGSRAEGLEDSLKLWFVLREGRYFRLQATIAFTVGRKRRIQMSNSTYAKFL